MGIGCVAPSESSRANRATVNEKSSYCHPDERSKEGSYRCCVKMFRFAQHDTVALQFIRSSDKNCLTASWAYESHALLLGGKMPELYAVFYNGAYGDWKVE